ncbi:hypothetical protein C8R45DRAFT_1211800 [Mycena sanguinolenta]|nr:hypothetical protein C8R45DRAFT_1211800 [Mycena sanguinolenta]
MASTEASTSHLSPTTDTTAPSTAAAHTEPASETEGEHTKHGLSAIIDKIVHPHGHSKDHHKDHSHPDAPSVEVAVPATASDGQAHLAPGGSAVGGIL